MNRKQTIVSSMVSTLVLVALLLVATGTWAQGEEQGLAPLGQADAVPSTISYQGRLLNADGSAVEGTHMMSFRIYAQESGGAPLWSVDLPVEVDGGLFHVHLAVDPALFGGEALWLGVEVEGDGEELTPRQPLLPVPYALHALTAPWAGLTGVPPGLDDGDDDTTYTSGTGLSLVDTEFNISVSYRLPQGCGGGQIAEWDGSAWQCGDDDTGTGGGGWSLTGNSGTDPTVNYLGTADAVSLTLAVSGTPALRLEPTGVSPNLIGGYGGNSVAPGAVGAAIGGGGDPFDPNQVTADYGTVGGGLDNTSSGAAAVGGGQSNTASGSYSTIGGGFGNEASADGTTVGGGSYNEGSGAFSGVGGGFDNAASGTASTVGGGYGNTSTGWASTTGGGESNNAAGRWATVGGGYSNTATLTGTTIAGGHDNVITAEPYGSNEYSTIGGGAHNIITGSSSTIAGGEYNRAGDGPATVGGGFSNTAVGYGATVAGGDHNTASDYYATVPGGVYNTASGSASFAAGREAYSTHRQSFVWSGGEEETYSWGDYTFGVRAEGGARFYTADGTGTGVQLAAGGSSWSSISDRNAKEGFAAVDAERLLDVLAALPIQTWNLKAQSAEMRHVGPVAQDFNGEFAYLFGEVESPTHINNMDAIGVALAAAQGLYALSQEQAGRIQELEAENATLRQQVGDLEARMTALERGAGVPRASGLHVSVAWLSLGGFGMVLLVGLAAIAIAARRKRSRGGVL